MEAGEGDGLLAHLCKDDAEKLDEIDRDESDDGDEEEVG